MRSGSSSESMPVMPFGLPGSTMMASEFVANVCGSSPLLPASVSLSMFFWSADANTSAGAPSLIWPTRSDDAAKLNVTSASGYSDSNASPIAVNESVSDAAANTVMSPSMSASGVVVANAVSASATATQAAANGPTNLEWARTTSE